MKTAFFPFSLFPPLAATAAVALCLILAPATSQALTSSPYVSQTQTDVALNQSTDDSVNGLVPFYIGTVHTPPESGSIARLSDATSATTPSANVIPGPENTEVRIAWDLGEPDAGKVWRLDRVDIWIAGSDNLRKGYAGSFSVSLTGDDGDFTAIPNSLHEADLTENSNYNYLRYDFPTEFIAGDDPDQDRYPVENFRYVMLNSFGMEVSGTDWQSRYVEIDIWATQIPEPGTWAMLIGGLLLLGCSFRRRRP